MKKSLKLFLIFLITLVSFSFNQDDKPSFILEKIDLNNDTWVITIGKTADISKEFGDTVNVITDINIMKENKNTFSILPDKRCVNTTPPFRVTLYKNGHNYSRKYYCFPDQLQLGILKGHTEIMVLKKLYPKDRVDYLYKKDSLINCGDMVLLSMEREDDFLIKYFTK